MTLSARSWIISENSCLTFPENLSKRRRREFKLKRVIKLASNENPLGPSPKGRSAAARALKEIHRYPDASGYRLKNALSDPSPKRSMIQRNRPRQRLERIIDLSFALIACREMRSSPRRRLSSPIRSARRSMACVRSKRVDRGSVVSISRAMLKFLRSGCSCSNRLHREPE